MTHYQEYFVQTAGIVKDNFKNLKFGDSGNIKGVARRSIPSIYLCRDSPWGTCMCLSMQHRRMSLADHKPATTPQHALLDDPIN